MHSKHVSLNRIKIQVILLILQLETDYFSSCSFQKSSIRSSGTTVFTETSRTAILHEEVLQDSSAPILQGYPYTIQLPYTLHRSREFSIQNPILHAEDKELFEYYYYIQGAKRPSFKKRNSTHRRQGDLLEIHVCVTSPYKGIPGIPATRPAKGIPDIPEIPVFPVVPVISDIPVIHDLPAFQAILQVPVPPGNPPHSSILQLECIFYSSIGFHRNSTGYQLDNTNYKNFTNVTFFKEREML